MFAFRPPEMTTTVLALALTALLHGCSGGGGETATAPPTEPEPPGPPSSSVQWDLDWSEGAVFYEIFVRSFEDADGDGVGDLAGLIQRLDYLNDGDPATQTDLGVEGLWLMPTFESPSYHGYDVVDYETVDAEYGANEDLAMLVEEANRRGIRVILDFIINHTSVQHRWFEESAQGPQSASRDWYVWRADNPGWTQPWGSGPVWHQRNDAYYYGIFWSGMPDLNYRTQAVRDEVIRLARLWLDRGVDGFRLDAARHIIADGPGDAQNNTEGTHAFWKEFSAAIREHRPEALLVGENWDTLENIAAYYGSTEDIERGDELPMNFNFPLSSAILEAVLRGDPRGLLANLNRQLELFPPGALCGTFLTNHDQIRTATFLGGNQRMMRTAAAIMLTLPGTPFIYYGEELGMQNGPTGEGDPAKRTPMPWAATGGSFDGSQPWSRYSPGRAQANVAGQVNDPDSMLSHYRRLIRLRAEQAALRRGDLTLLSPAESAGVLAFTRAHDGERLFIAHNLTDQTVTAGLFRDLPLPVETLYGGETAAAEAVEGGLRITLPPGAAVVWKLE